jgi:hypothetical protein
VSVLLLAHSRERVRTSCATFRRKSSIQRKETQYHEGFFAEIGELKADASGPFSTKPPDIEKIMRVGKRYGFEILPPTSSEAREA